MPEQQVPQLASQLIMDNQARFPVNEVDATESSSDTLSGTEGSLITASITPRSNSKVLLMASCQLNNDAATAREINLFIRRGSATDRPATLQLTSQLEARAADKRCITFCVVDSPATTAAITYDLRGTTDAGSPTATNKSIVAIELPAVTKFG